MLGGVVVVIHEIKMMCSIQIGIIPEQHTCCRIFMSDLHCITAERQPRDCYYPRCKAHPVNAYLLSCQEISNPSSLSQPKYPPRDYKFSERLHIGQFQIIVPQQSRCSNGIIFFPAFRHSLRKRANGIENATLVKRLSEIHSGAQVCGCIVGKVRVCVSQVS